MQEPPDAVFEMNDEIAFIELAEIDLGAVAAELFGALQPAPPVRRVAAEQFRPGKNHEVPVGKHEAARERSFDEFDAFEIAHDLAEALDLAFGLEVNDDARSGWRAIRSSARKTGRVLPPPA